MHILGIFIWFWEEDDTGRNSSKMRAKNSKKQEFLQLPYSVVWTWEHINFIKNMDLKISQKQRENSEEWKKSYKSRKILHNKKTLYNTYNHDMTVNYILIVSEYFHQ